MEVGSFYFYIAIGVACVIFALFIWNIVLTVKLSKLKKRFNTSITNYSENFNLEEMLCKTVSEVNSFRAELNENVKVCAEANNKTNEKFDEKVDCINKRIEAESTTLREMIDVINKNLQICVQKTAVIRYNPFSDVGGELCFALAMLDKKNDGYILNSIYTQESGCYIYCKPVEGGVSTINLSKEEEEALALAKNKY